MRLLISFFFFTFVLLGVPGWSASPKSLKPVTTKEELQGKNLEEGRDQIPDPSRLEPTNPADFGGEAGPLQKPERPSWGPVDLNLHSGFMQGDLVETDGDEENTYNVAFLGIRYIPHEKQTQSFDYTMEVDSKNLVHVQVGYRWSLADGAFHKGYYRVGFADFIKPSQGLGGLINLRHMKIMGAFGVSDLFKWNRRIVAEIGAGYGMTGTAIYLQAGYNFNF